ncbi:MAG: glycerophosphoryl diester [Geobacteraceae bacterium]|nr:MAG: glycerophosphoryl diester [Geobacteraceae bacterium]
MTTISAQEARTPLVIAHRGDSCLALENSPDAIRRAVSLPVDMIEIDTRKSRDGVLFVMHDRETGRTAVENIDIERSTAEEVSRVRLRNGEPVPTLAHVLGLVAGRAALDLEIKSKGAGELAARHLLSSGYTGEVLITSFHERELLAANRVAPALPLAGIFDTFPTRHVKRYKAKGYRTVCIEKRGATLELMAACREEGVNVYVWTVDDEDEMRKFIAWGVDGICTNRPGMLKEVIRRVHDQCPV